MSGMNLTPPPVKFKAKEDLPRRHRRPNENRPTYLGHMSAVRGSRRRDRYPGQSTAYLVGANK